MNIRKIIKEELLKEVGGYDDPSVMASHAGITLGALSTALNDLSLIISGLANALMDGTTKEEVKGYLSESFDEIEEIKDGIKKNIKDFTEDRLISESKTFLIKLNNFQKKINILIGLSDVMGGDMEYFQRVKDLLIELVPSVQKYSEELKTTSKMFYDRFSGKDRGIFNMGFDNN